MTTLTIRPWRVPDDFPAAESIFSATQPEPTSMATLVEREERLNKEAIRERLVAVDADNRVIGLSGCVHNPWSKPGKFWLWIAVDPNQRQLGAGKALLAASEQFARDHGATELEGEVRDNDPRSILFAEVAGYQRHRHVFESTLNLSTFDGSRFSGVIEAAEASGLRFTSLAETGGETIERNLYAAIARDCLDIPGWDNPTFQPFEEWRKWNLEGESAPWDQIIFALDGDQVAGITQQQPVKGTGGVWTFHTSVTREYRGRNLSLALKLLAIEAAKRLGAPYMRTNNDSDNGPMLAVNRKLGYESAPGVYFMKKSLP
jgi:GNAT superfamily N-acetyltransferase